MAKFMLIGGGNVGRGDTLYETSTIDKEIVNMSEKEKPNFLFVGIASSFSDSYFKTIKKIYTDLGCECSYLKKKNIINNPDIVKEKISSADIIYFCGGDSIKLYNELLEYKIDKLLEDAVNNNTVIAGMSAGAIVMCKDGYSDSKIIRNESDKYEFVSGLGFLDISFCPHFDLNGSKAKELEQDMVNLSKRVLSVPDKCAIKIIDDTYEIVCEDESIKAYLCYCDKEFITKSLDKSDSISKIVLK